MWVLEKIGVSEVRGDIDESDIVYVPHLRYDMHIRLRFQHVWLRMFDPETGSVIETRCNRRQWGRLGGFLKKYNPYGCVVIALSQDGHVDYNLVAVDKLSYQFLELVDEFTKVESEFASLVARRRHFIALDKQMTLFNMRRRGKPQFGFPLMQIILYTPENWDEDGNFYICVGNAVASVFRVDFTDSDKARAYLGKALMLYGKNPVETGMGASMSVYIS